eukprot:366133-Chlamydomonas_euryale.AAC.3
MGGAATSGSKQDADDGTCLHKDRRSSGCRCCEGRPGRDRGLSGQEPAMNCRHQPPLPRTCLASGRDMCVCYPGGAQDEDDPFFMPLPSALKLADASMFANDLAKPIAVAKPGAAPFMIEMAPEEEDRRVGAAAAAAGGGAEHAAAAAPGGEHAANGVCLTELDFEPVGASELPPMPAEAMARVGSAGMDRASSGGITVWPSSRPESAATSGPPGGSRPASAVSRPTSASGRDLASSKADSVAVAAAGIAAAAAAEEGGVAATIPEEGAKDDDDTDGAGASGAPEAGGAKDDEAAGDATAPLSAAQQQDPKLQQFVNFLHGENPGACMFHAQMRLSLDGCRKLANFINGSDRVRALSLSHNHIGDDGLRILCEGIRRNGSVTALDLPDNSISDAGAAELVSALKGNGSLTQLQLAYNRITDIGAVTLANYLTTTGSLKRLGLAYNQIGRPGCQALSTAMSKNRSLKHLQILPGAAVRAASMRAVPQCSKGGDLVGGFGAML